MARLTRLEILASEDDAELVSGILAMHVAYGWEEKALPTGDVMCLVHSGHAGFCKELEETVRHAVPAVTTTLSEVEDVNWLEAWKEFFTPVEAGRHFLVLAPWMHEEQKSTDRLPLLIEPKMAFGTGHHATTALCLTALSSLVDSERVQKGMRFFDLGTGSGILGIAAAMLGLTGEGCDIDYVSVENALENRELNGVAEGAFVLSHGGVEKMQGPYDLVMANILAGPLKDMAQEVVAGLGKRPDGSRGCLVLSGILDIQADSVEQAYQAAGLGAASRYALGEWVALVFA